MATVIGTVTAAGPQTKPRQDGSTYQLNVVKIDEQEYVARKDVCNVATGLLGQRVEAVTRVEQKGKYTNFYLDFISLAGGASAPGQGEYVTAAQQAQQAQPQPVSVTTTAQPLPITPAQQAQDAQSVADVREQLKQLSIHRQTAAKVAALISTNPQDFWVNVEDLVIFFNSGSKPHARHAVLAEPVYEAPKTYTQPMPASPNQFIPAQDPGSELPVPTDDDIPF